LHQNADESVEGVEDALVAARIEELHIAVQSFAHGARLHSTAPIGVSTRLLP